MGEQGQDAAEAGEHDVEDHDDGEHLESSQPLTFFFR